MNRTGLVAVAVLAGLYAACVEDPTREPGDDAAASETASGDVGDAQGGGEVSPDSGPDYLVPDLGRSCGACVWRSFPGACVWEVCFPDGEDCAGALGPVPCVSEDLCAEGVGGAAWPEGAACSLNF